MFLQLTNRFGHNMSEGEKVTINFDKVVSIRSGNKGANLDLADDRLRQFLCFETQEEILQMLAESSK